MAKSTNNSRGSTTECTSQSDKSRGRMSRQEEQKTLACNRKRAASPGSTGTSRDTGRKRRKKQNTEARKNFDVSSEIVRETTTLSLTESFDTSHSVPCRQTLRWHSEWKHVPQKCELSMLKVILRWHETERGMMKDQPPFRLKEIKEKCKSTGMSLPQALSLRRHHMKLLNPKMTMTQLGLGDEDRIRQAAALFENTVAQYLDKCKVRYKGEKEQLRDFYRRRKKGDETPPTPDFMLKEPVDLHENASSPSDEMMQHTIMWIEAKMFFGASTIPDGDNSAVGRLLSTARKYVKNYGPGAMVFSYGCGDTLANELLRLGVVALDVGPLNLKKVEKHQRKWCANKSGEILP